MLASLLLAVAAADATAQSPSRCATRLSIAILGRAATPALQSSANPQSQTRELIKDPAFAERFARYINARFNVAPDSVALNNSAYHLAKFLLLDGTKQWRELYLGKYKTTESSGKVSVVADAAGRGMFTKEWRMRYAGDDEDGYTLPAAYRLFLATVGLSLVATTNAPNADVSQAGRKAPSCAGCHYEPNFGLDLAATIMTRRKGTGEAMTFTAPVGGPQTLLGGKTLANETELVTALVDSTDFRFHTCRLAFRFLNGRNESVLDGAVFDRCMDAFTASGMVQDAVATVAEDVSFCHH